MGESTVMNQDEPLNKVTDELNIKRARLTAVMMIILSVMALLASLAGVFIANIYKDVFAVGTISDFLLVGSIAQDIISIPLALLLTLLSILFLIKHNYKILITMIGLSGYFFYGYGLYVMQGQYTSIYLLYLAVFSLSIYSMILGFLSFTSECLIKTSISFHLRISISIFLYMIVIMLGVVWLLRIIPDISCHTPQATYGVFILDLGIVFPAITIAATQLICRKDFGNILAGVSLIKTTTVCLSWGFAELYTRIYENTKGGYNILAIPVILMTISFVFFLLYITKLSRKF